MKCPRCKFYNICKGRLNETVENCVRFKSVEQTNEEWFDGLATEEKAKTIKMVINICISCTEHGAVRTKGCHLRQNMAKNLLFLPCMDEDGICEWLKQPHNG